MKLQAHVRTMFYIKRADSLKAVTCSPGLILSSLVLLRLLRGWPNPSSVHLLRITIASRVSGACIRGRSPSVRLGSGSGILNRRRASSLGDFFEIYSGFAVIGISFDFFPSGNARSVFNGYFFIFMMIWIPIAWFQWHFFFFVILIWGLLEILEHFYDLDSFRSSDAKKKIFVDRFASIVDDWNR